MSELHKWCDAADLPRRSPSPYNPSLSIRVRGWFLARWDALKFALEAPERRRLRREMDVYRQAQRERGTPGDMNRKREEYGIGKRITFAFDARQGASGMWEATTPYRAVVWIGETRDEAIGAMLYGLCEMTKKGYIDPEKPYAPGKGPTL